MKYKRWGHSADLIAGYVYLFGGACNGYKNDLHLFDVDDGTLQTAVTTGNPPSKREFHGSAVI